MLVHEWLAVVYFAALGIAAPLTHAAWSRRLAVCTGAAATAALIVVMAFAAGDALRAWVPHVYLVVGYWMPALLARLPADPTRFEHWRSRSDGMLRPRLWGMPAPLVHLTELAYLVCYLLVPASFAVVWRSGPTADENRFWIAVLIAGYSCYASLPWLVSRPPRHAARTPHVARHVAAVNVFVLRRVSHELNTFPSGHVAVSLAAAAAAAPVSPLAGVLVGGTALAVAAGAVAGRYHYVIDVVLGVAIAAVAVSVAFAVSGP